MTSIDELYQDLILDHCRSPRNFGRLEGASHAADGHNPLCGDKLHLELRFEEGRIADVRFEGEGCAISTASASVMTDALRGMDEEEARATFETFRALVMEEDAPAAGGKLGKLQAFAGVRRFPVRVKCAMLPWRTFESAIASDQETVTTE